MSEAEDRVRNFTLNYRRRFGDRLTQVASVVGSHGEIFVLKVEDLEAVLGITRKTEKPKRVRIVRSK